MKLCPCWKDSQPGSKRMRVPALPTSIGFVGDCALRSPQPRISNSSPRGSTIAPTRWIAARVERVSAASR